MSGMEQNLSPLFDRLKCIDMQRQMAAEHAMHEQQIEDHKEIEALMLQAIGALQKSMLIMSNMK